MTILAGVFSGFAQQNPKPVSMKKYKPISGRSPHLPKDPLYKDPMYPKGLNGLMNDVSKALKSSFHTSGRLYGKVYISFCVAEDGSVQCKRIAFNGSSALDTAVLKGLDHLHPWIPAYYNDTPVKTTFTLPVTFTQPPASPPTVTPFSGLMNY